MRSPQDLTDRDPLDLIAEEFASRCRRGERPTIDEYVARYPDCAEDLKVLLPTVGFLERGRSEMARPRSGETPSLGRFGDHRVIREIGRGGMGIVYEAIQEPLGRRVAVKVLPRPSAADARSRERFLREARAIARLKHPNIVPIFSVGESENVPYYVMELIDGFGLDRPFDSPKENPARARWVADLGVQAANALAHAHGQGILHRDVKPANLILESSGRVWLTDFGLAKLADDLTLTETGGLPGTLRYIAPECLDSDGDHRSDLYSLGLTLYELLLGRPAFGESNRVRLLQQVRDADPPRPRSVDPEIPRNLETIILKAMARDPDSRYASAAELSQDLTRFLEGRPISARPAGSLERLSSLVRRNRLVSSLSAATIVLGLAALYFGMFYVMAPRRPREPDFEAGIDPGRDREERFPFPRDGRPRGPEPGFRREGPPGKREFGPGPDDGMRPGPEDRPRGRFGPGGPGADRKGQGSGPRRRPPGEVRPPRFDGPEYEDPPRPDRPPDDEPPRPREIENPDLPK